MNHSPPPPPSPKPSHSIYVASQRFFQANRFPVSHSARDTSCTFPDTCLLNDWYHMYVVRCKSNFSTSPWHSNKGGWDHCSSLSRSPQCTRRSSWKSYSSSRISSGQGQFSPRWKLRSMLIWEDKRGMDGQLVSMSARGAQLMPQAPNSL